MKTGLVIDDKRKQTNKQIKREKGKKEKEKKRYVEGKCGRKA